VEVKGSTPSRGTILNFSKQFIMAFPKKSYTKNQWSNIDIKSWVKSFLFKIKGLPTTYIDE